MVAFSNNFPPVLKKNTSAFQDLPSLGRKRLKNRLFSAHTKKHYLLESNPELDPLNKDGKMGENPSFRIVCFLKVFWNKSLKRNLFTSGEKNCSLIHSGI
jgi:hypothetical protein